MVAAWVDAWTHRRTGGQTDRRTDGRTDTWMEWRYTYRVAWMAGCSAVAACADDTSRDVVNNVLRSMHIGSRLGPDNFDNFVSHACTSVMVYFTGSFRSGGTVLSELRVDVTPPASKPMAGNAMHWEDETRASGICSDGRWIDPLLYRVCMVWRFSPAV